MNILVVSDNEKLAKSLSEKLFFLRQDDNIILSTYENAHINQVTANIVLVHENENFEATCELINKLKENNNLGIIFLADSYNSETILQASDSGADDFILTSADDFEFVIRIVNNIKYNSGKALIFRDSKLLEQQKIKNQLTGLYEFEYAKQVIENVIDNDLIQQGSFMVTAPSKKGKTNFSIEEFAKLLKNSVRSCDVITMGKGLNFYVFLPSTGVNGAIAVLNKIRENSSFEVCAGISEIHSKSYEKFEKDALKALSEAYATSAEFVYADDETTETLDGWLDNDGVKGYKIFRQMFNKKLEKVITPVFYRLQKTYEEKLFNTDIEQYITDEQCVFKLKNKKNTSTLSIVYPGFSKIIVSIIHDGLDSPENNEIHLPLAKVTQRELVEIIENFIKEFKTR